MNNKSIIIFYRMVWNAFKKNEIGIYYLFNGSLECLISGRNNNV